MILIEGGDRVFVPIELETATGDGNLALEISEEYSSRKLLYTELLDVIIEEETVAQEEDFKMLIEEGTGAVSQTFIHENGSDTLVLEHRIGDYGTEPAPLENVSQGEFRIEDFVANIALEDDGSILLEERTPTGLGIVLVSENGDRFIHDGHDSDLLSAVFLLAQHSYVGLYSSGQVVIHNDQSTSLATVELVGDFEFPYGTFDARIEFANEGPDTATITTVIDDYLLDVDLGSVVFEDGERTLNEDDSGDIVAKRDYANATAQNYKLEYGRYTQDSTIDDNRYMKCELNAADPTFNNRGYGYQFVIDGFFSTDGGTAGQINLEEFEERIGNDVVQEDGSAILIEDGEITQDPNAILLEDDSTYLTFEENDSLLLENDVGYEDKLLNFEPTEFRIEYIANNTFMKFSNETHLFNDMSIRANHLEQVPA